MPGAAADVDADATLGERRATALLDLVLGQPAVQVTAEIGVVIDLATLVGLDDQPAVARTGADEPTSLDELRARVDRSLAVGIARVAAEHAGDLHQRVEVVKG